MKYSIEKNSQGLRINADVGPAKQQHLLEEFAKCANGTCSCPSTQFEKLQSVDVSQTQSGVSVVLTVKSGEVLDQSDIEKCLNHTAQTIAG